ncbi:MAG TPA: hypothetical protein VGG05_06405 [Pseudonocardiaceae bacterium]|jgi:uncharacterized protein YegL
MRNRVLPFYVVCDESYSMTDHMDTLRARLRELHHCIRANPVVSTVVRVCLIGFADTARLVVPLSAPHDMDDIGTFSTRAASNFGAVFTLLRETIERDVAELRAQSYDIHRPIVFFLSDGQPTDPAMWQHPYARLVEPAWPDRPKIVAFGIGDADPVTIRAVGEFKAFVADQNGGTSPGEALDQFAQTLADSMLSAATSPDRIDLPEQVRGYTAIRTHCC